MSKIIYSIECFEKKGDRIIKTVLLPETSRINYRKIFDAWNKKQIIDEIKIDKRLRVKLIARCNVNIDIRKFDCVFSESYVKT